MEQYNLGEGIIAFTTDRNIGRDEQLLLEALHLPTAGEAGYVPLLYPHQTHTDNVAIITDDFLRQPIEAQREQLEGVDAVISCSSNAVFGISTADCIPVVVYDKENHVAAAIHAGWKGTVQRIVEKTILLMQEHYAIQPSQCTAVIGPGISQDSFEVGNEVVERFAEAGFDMQRYVKMMPLMNGKQGEKPHIDLKEINRQQLLNAGIELQNIQVSDIDTFTDARFFSARREQKPVQPGEKLIKCGRILSGFFLG